MKRLTILFVLMSSMAMAQFSPTYDTVKFKSSRGKIYEVITYSDDSVRLNGVILRSGAASATTNYWQPDGTSAIQPNPHTKIITYPHLPMWNSSISPQYDCEVWWKRSDGTLRSHISLPVTIDPEEMITGDQDNMIFTQPASDTYVVLDSMSKMGRCFMIKNVGENSSLSIYSLEGYNFDISPLPATKTITLAYGEWVNICPNTTNYITTSNLSVVDSVSYYSKAQADTVFVKQSERDSMYRYSIYSSGNENIEVLASSNTVTASVVGGTDVTLTIPKGVQLMSVKMRWENRSSFTVTVVNTGGATPSMSNRWMPNIAAWREDTGAQLKAVNSIMDISVYNKFLVNGLDNSTKCQVRLDL